MILPYDGSERYTVDIRGLERVLPLIQVSEDTWIAYMDSLGDLELIEHCARELAPYLEGTDILITSETKGIPLAHAVGKILKHSRYVPCRKGRRPFMSDPLSVEYKPITSQEPLELCVDRRYAERMNGKK